MEPNSPKRLGGVIDAARVIHAFCEQKIGWGRIGVVISLTIIAIAAYVLYNILRGIDFKEVVEALVTTEPRDIMLAALFVAGGYFTLTFYDLFALRTIGRPDVPYRIAALGGFTSYSIGHNVGASVFTGGAVRYRVYSAWGLDAIEVAKLCFIAGLTFWLGNATVLGLGIAYVPDGLSAINQLPNWFNRLLAFATLCVLALYVAWVWTGRRVVGRDGWQVTLPGGPLTLLQIGIGIVDLTFCAFAMYVLMPDEPHIGFVTLAVIFVSATLLGFASHSPGGYRRFRRRHAGRALAVPQGRSAGRAAAVPVALLHRAVCAFAADPGIARDRARRECFPRAGAAAARSDAGALRSRAAFRIVTVRDADRLLPSPKRWFIAGTIWRSPTANGSKAAASTGGSAPCAWRLAPWRLSWARCGCSVRWPRCRRLPLSS